MYLIAAGVPRRCSVSLIVVSRRLASCGLALALALVVAGGGRRTPVRALVRLDTHAGGVEAYLIARDKPRRVWWQENRCCEVSDQVSGWPSMTLTAGGCAEACLECLILSYLISPSSTQVRTFHLKRVRVGGNCATVINQILISTPIIPHKRQHEPTAGLGRKQRPTPAGGYSGP